MGSASKVSGGMHKLTFKFQLPAKLLALAAVLGSWLTLTMTLTLTLTLNLTQTLGAPRDAFGAGRSARLRARRGG